jgi:hypothetical protein
LATPNTPVVFWKVSDVTAAVAKQPKLVKVLMSATIPAPPDGSKPAMVSATRCVSVVCENITLRTDERKGSALTLSFDQRLRAKPTSTARV